MSKSLTNTARRVRITLLLVVTFSLTAAPANSNERRPSYKISAMKAMLFYEDKGTFSTDVSEVDSGPPYVPPKLWNTPMQYEKRSTSVFVTVEVSGDEGEPQSKLEFVARYIPWQREQRPIVVRKIMTISIPVQGGPTHQYHAGFWLYDTGCNPVRLSARIIGMRGAPVIKRVIKFGCGE